MNQEIYLQLTSLQILIRLFRMKLKELETEIMELFGQSHLG